MEPPPASSLTEITRASQVGAAWVIMRQRVRAVSRHSVSEQESILSAGSFSLASFGSLQY